MKVMIYQGTDLLTQNQPSWADYWAGLGFDGYFLANNPWYSWSNDVGTDSNSMKWQQTLDFRQLYHDHGVTDMYIKASPYYAVNWDVDTISACFGHAAALAKFAGAGLAIDMEPQSASPTLWTVDSSDSDKAQKIHDVGVACGAAIYAAYPSCPLICLPETVYYVSTGLYPAYALSANFWNGLRTGREGRYIGTEVSYDAADPVAATKTVIEAYVKVGSTNALPSIGLWPLGPSYTSKLARSGYTVAEFYTKVTNSVSYLTSVGSSYLWIYGGWAWQGSGLDPNFQQYADVIRGV